MTPSGGFEPRGHLPLHPYLDHPGPIPLAHRGFCVDAVENSVPAFQAAVDLGYRYIETDTQVTRDGVALAFHDATLDRVTDRTGPVGALDRAEVSHARLGDDGEIPTMADVLAAWPDVRWNIDVKSAAAVPAIVDVIERTWAHDRVCVASFSDRRRRAVLRKLSRPVASSPGQRGAGLFVVGAVTRVTPLARRGSGDVDCLQLPLSTGLLGPFAPPVLAAARRVGVPVHVWTVNDAAEMGRLLDLGVDGVVTDRADLLRTVLQDRGQWYPR